MEICKHDEFCGGCIYQGIPYEEQLKIKEKEVLGYLKDRNIEYGEFLGIEPCPNLYAYRNKMEYTFGDLIKGGEMTLGMHKKGNFMSIITVDECQLVESDFNVILKATLDFCCKRNYMHYNKKSHEGLVRNLIIRKGQRTDELLVNIVTTSQSNFDETSYVNLLRNLELNSEIVGILRTINDNLADAVVCQELKTLWGREYYTERIMDLDFKVSAFSFFQTNIEAIERLYYDATSKISDLEGKVIYDLFCGTGTISQILAQKAKHVIGVELVEEAVAAARENAKMNGIENCTFIAGDVFDVLDSIDEIPDAILVDPPRMGIQDKALRKILFYGVKEIVYVSCNPKTMAINLQMMEEYGYYPVQIKAYDNFPMTKHVETIVLLSKLDSKNHISVELPMDDMDLTSAESKATYKQIQIYVLEKFGFKVSTLYIAQVKRKFGLEVREHYNISRNENQKVPQCPIEKEEAILDALKNFKMLYY